MSEIKAVSKFSIITAAVVIVASTAIAVVAVVIG